MSQFSRRQFLKRAVAMGAVSGFPMILSSRALGADGAIAPSDRITMGCIGVGGQGTVNMMAFLNNPQVQVVAVCDVDRNHRERAKAAVEQHYAQQTVSGTYHGCADYNDFRDLLARNDIDAITICTPDHWHPTIAVAAAKAGKDMYCEKPLANSIAEGRAVVEAVKRYDRVLQVGSHERSRDSVRYACELVRNGRLGTLRRIHVNLPLDTVQTIAVQPEMPVPDGFDYNMWLGPAPWAPYTERRCHFWFRYILDYSGGEMTDRGAHILDIAQLGAGMDHTGPIEIEASGEASKDGLFDSYIDFNFRCLYENGVEVIGQSSGPRGLRFEGDKGWIFIIIHGGMLEASDNDLLREQILPGELSLGRSPGHHQDFLNCVRTRTQPMAPVEIGHRSASFCHLINIALRSGAGRIEWDPVREIITNNVDANRYVSPTLRTPWAVI